MPERISTMANGFWEKRESGRIPFADKAILTKNKTPFRIIAANHRDSNNPEYGSQLVLTCETIFDDTQITDDMVFIEGASFNLGFGWNDARSQMHVDLNAALADGEIITAQLYTFDAKGGKTYDIEPAPNF